MPNLIDATGLQTATVAELLDILLNGTPTYPGYYQIYGPDINVGPNSPDGQTINIFAQIVTDMLDLIVQVNAGMDPDQAIGRVLDQRCAINGVTRRGATYTQQAVDVTATQPVMLDGLDTSPTSPFSISDSAGNQFQLISAYSFVAAGTQSLAFQAAALGAVQTTPNTLTNIVTVILGISSVNNPGAATAVGVDEETDSALRVRRANSVSLPSQGYLQGLIGALLDTSGVLQAIVLENVTNATDANGVPAHSIWCIVLGGSNADVAHAIYVKRNAGCGMKGSIVVAQPTIDGSPAVSIQFDRPTNQNLYVRLTVVAITGSVDLSFIANQILLNFIYGINQAADTASIVAFVKSIVPNASISGEGVSNDGATWVSLLTPTAVNNQFQLSAGRISVT